MTKKFTALSLLVMMIAMLFLVVDAFAFTSELSCQLPQDLGGASDIAANKKDAEGFFRKIIQMLIDFWLHMVRFTIDFICNLFRSFGFQCG